MAKINKPHTMPSLRTHEGAHAKRIDNYLQLRRSVLSCLLWEKNFYEDGQSIAERISDLVETSDNDTAVAALAIEARTRFKLRHASLWVAANLAAKRQGFLVGETVREVIQRADELGEFLAMYWHLRSDNKISRTVRRGLAIAFKKFDAYHLAKYNRDEAVKLRDIAFLCHVRQRDIAKGKVIANLVNKSFFPAQTKSSKFPVKEYYGLEGVPKLAAPDTWEVALSAGKDKKETFTRLLKEHKLGYLALLRNLRNMREAGVAAPLVFAALSAGAANSKALPFRFVAAARAVPAWEQTLDACMQKALEGQERLRGRTGILVDVSGSMEDPLSEKSDLSRMDAACSLAVLIRGICSEVAIYSFSNYLKPIPPRGGMALIDAIQSSQDHQGTELGEALKWIYEVHRSNQFDDPPFSLDRLIVITDEQSRDEVMQPYGRGYLINVGAYQNGVGYGKWIHIDGFSEAVVDFIREYERECDAT